MSPRVLLFCITVCGALRGQENIITTIAGSGVYGTPLGDGGPATAAYVVPVGIAVDRSGDIFIGDTNSLRVRKISGGVITTVAGNGVRGFSGDGGPATSASLAYPSGVAVDGAGNLYIADASNNVVRRVAAATGIITTVAGTGQAAFSGDGGPATSAALDTPFCLAVDSSGTLFISDTGNLRIRKVSSNGIISTIAGKGGFAAGFSGDGGPATAAALGLDGPCGIAADGAGNVFFSDFINQRIRKVSADGIITTVAGNGATSGSGILQLGSFSGDGGPATQASLSNPSGVAVDALGNLFIDDYANSRIREVTPNGIINTYAGSGTEGFSGDGGPATAAKLFAPENVALDTSGNVFIADTFNGRVRKVQTAGALGVQNAASYAAGAVSPGEMVVLYGRGMGPRTLTSFQIDPATGLVKTSLAGTSVSFNGVAAPLLYTSATQVSAIVPYEVQGSAAVQILVQYNGTYAAALLVPVAPASPAVFTWSAGTGQAAALNQDGTLNSASNPAAAGSTIVLYVTGGGQTSPASVDGQLASAGPYAAPVAPVVVTIGGLAASYTYAGAAPGEIAGIMQINATIPPGLSGNAAVSVAIGGMSSQSGVTIAVQ